MMENVHDVLHMLQGKVSAPKDRTNDFAGFNYRTTEGILAVTKPHLPDGAHLTLRDEPAELCGKLVLKATATLYYLGETVSATSFALHAFIKKGMDDAMISGSASSYARKYALSGLLAIDDGTQDPDAGKLPETLSPDQVSQIQELAEQAKVSDGQVCKMAQVQHLADIPADWFDNFKDRLIAAAQKRDETQETPVDDAIPY